MNGLSKGHMLFMLRLSVRWDTDATLEGCPALQQHP